MELLSVIVPVYNVKKYLKKCLDTILAQTYKQIEVIIVDDGSTDGSAKICDEYKKKDVRITVVHKKNAGLGLARNTGLQLISGKYVTFVDSDDYLDKRLFEKLMNPILKLGCDTSIGGSTNVDNAGNVHSITQYKEEILEKEAVYGNLFCRMLGTLPQKHDSIKMAVWSSIYSVDVIKRYKIKFPSERKLISEDIVYDKDYFFRAQKVAITNVVGYFYRFNPKSLSQKYDSEKFKKFCYLYKYLNNNIEWEKMDSTGKIRLQKKFIINVQACIFQENHRLSKKNFRQRYLAIKRICEDNVVNKVFYRYPSSRLQIKPRIFVNFVKWKFIFLLTIVVG